MVRSCEPTDSIQWGEFLGQLTDYRISEDVSKKQDLFIECVTYIRSNYRTAVNSEGGKCDKELTVLCFINLLKPTAHVMHQQFNSQQLYALPTLYLCVLYLSEKKQRLVPLTA